MSISSVSFKVNWHINLNILDGTDLIYAKLSLSWGELLLYLFSFISYTFYRVYCGMVQLGVNL